MDVTAIWLYRFGRCLVHRFVYHAAEKKSGYKRIPWTPDLAQVPEIARGHHEKLDGSGYPKGITSERIPTPTRMMTISDIYDALTAKDRPYKKAVPHDKALDILKDEVIYKVVEEEDKGRHIVVHTLGFRGAPRRMMEGLAQRTGGMYSDIPDTD